MPLSFTRSYKNHVCQSLCKSTSGRWHMMVKQCLTLVLNKGFPFPPTIQLIHLFDELEFIWMRSTEISPCLFSKAVAILLYIVDVVLLFKTKSTLTKATEQAIWAFYSLDVNLSMTKIMIFGHKKEIKPRDLLPRQGPNRDNSWIY